MNQYCKYPYLFSSLLVGFFTFSGTKAYAESSIKDFQQDIKQKFQSTSPDSIKGLEKHHIEKEKSIVVPSSQRVLSSEKQLDRGLSENSSIETPSIEPSLASPRPEAPKPIIQNPQPLDFSQTTTHEDVSGEVVLNSKGIESQEIQDSSIQTEQTIQTNIQSHLTAEALLPIENVIGSTDVAQVFEEPSIEGPGSRPRLRREPKSPDEPVFRPREDILLEQSARYGPSSSVLTPTAFGKSFGDISVGIGFQERTRFSTKSDGAVGLGFGLGDPENLVGVDVNIAFTDLSEFFNRGIVSFKVHRRLPSNFAIAVGVNDALNWGNSDVDGPSPYGVVSKAITLRENTTAPLSRLTLSAGVGTGRYRTIIDTVNDNDNPNVFGSIALRVADPVNVITEWTGQDLTVGMSIRPFPKIPLVLTPAFTDITGNAGDGWRFIFGAGYIIQF